MLLGNKIMKKKILKTIKVNNLISPGMTLIAAISGGPDSMAMLDAVLELTRDWGVKIHVAHFNHMFRGEEAEEEATFVANTAKKMGLNCTVEALDVPLFLQETGLSPEEGARSLRYNFLERVRDKVKGDYIMTAHHANDQAETLLLHLLRGTGTEGLAAISSREGNLIRPMLGVTKEEIIAYCQERDLEFRLDPSNNEEIYTRNKVRLNLIPHLKQFNPQIIHSLVKTADICRGENDFLNQITGDMMDKINIMVREKQVSVNYREIKKLHPALQRRLIRQVVDNFTGSQGYLSFDHTEEVLGLKPGKELYLPGPIYAWKKESNLIFSKEKLPDQQFKIMAPVCLQVPGVTWVPELNIRIISEIVNWTDYRFSEERDVKIFNLDILQRPIMVRNRNPGDYFRPQGMKGRKKLKDFFIDEKIAVDRRDKIPLIFSGEEIIWVVGYRTGVETKVTSKDQEVVVMIVKSDFGHK